MDNVFLDQLAPIVQSDTKGDTHIYGKVASINSDGSYQVKLGASTTTTRCAKLCNANVNDIVMVLILKSGQCAAIGVVGGGSGGGGGTWGSITGTLSNQTDLYEELLDRPTIPVSISNGGTGQTTATAALGALGGVAWNNVTGVAGYEPAVIDLLWTNGSPDSNFAAQTITNLGLSDYDVIVLNIFNSGLGVRNSFFIPNGVSALVLNSAAYSSGAAFVYTREATVNWSAGSVTFGAGYYNSTSSNAQSKPYQIYGIKGVN